MRSCHSSRALACVFAIALAATGCEDGIRLNSDGAMTKRLTETPLAFSIPDPELDAAPELVWEHGSTQPDTPLLAEPDWTVNSHTAVAWDRAFVAGTFTRSELKPGERWKTEKETVAWYLVDLRDPKGPRVAYQGDSRPSYDAERSKLGVPPELVPRPLLQYWPNWRGSPRPDTRDGAHAELDPVTGAGSTTRALPVGGGYFVQDSLRTFLVLSKDPPDPKMSPTPVHLSRQTADVFRIGWDDRFIVADVCFLVSDGCSEPTVDRQMPVGTVVVDTKTGKSMWEVNTRSAAEIRKRFGVPDSLGLRDVLDVWPDWREIRRPWRKDPETLKHLGLE
jgi:hypothetical protein